MIKPRLSPPPKGMRTAMNYKKAVGGAKPLPKFRNLKSARWTRKGIRIGKNIMRQF